MDENIQNKISDYSSLYKEISSSVNNNVAIAGIIFQEVVKDRRVDAMKKDKEQKDNQPATEKQISYLESLEVKIPNELTKKQASELIENAVENKD